MRKIPSLVVSLLLVAGAAALASETVNYNYDARGRLVRVEHNGSVNANVVTNYVYDEADNRTQKKTTGVP
jgi:YD repeat-containing protein